MLGVKNHWSLVFEGQNLSWIKKSLGFKYFFGSTTCMGPIICLSECIIWEASTVSPCVRGYGIIVY